MSWGKYNDDKYAELLRDRAEARKNWEDGAKDWEVNCTACESLPTVHPTELCGPCCFGEAATLNGNW